MYSGMKSRSRQHEEQAVKSQTEKALQSKSWADEMRRLDSSMCAKMEWGRYHAKQKYEMRRAVEGGMRQEWPWSQTAFILRGCSRWLCSSRKMAHIVLIGAFQSSNLETREEGLNEVSLKLLQSFSHSSFYTSDADIDNQRHHSFVPISPTVAYLQRHRYENKSLFTSSIIVDTLVTEVHHDAHHGSVHALGPHL